LWTSPGAPTALMRAEHARPGALQLRYEIAQIDLQNLGDLEHLHEVEPSFARSYLDTNDCGRPSFSASWT